MTSDTEEKDAFCKQLNIVQERLSKGDILIVFVIVGAIPSIQGLEV